MARADYYKPGGAPGFRAVDRKMDAHFAWERDRDRAAGQMIDLLMAGRLDEAQDFQSVIDEIRGREPSIW